MAYSMFAFSNAVSTLRAKGRYGLAQRLHEAQEASESMARDALMALGVAMQRNDGKAAYEAILMASIHYRNAGDLGMAEHWKRRLSLWGCAPGVVRC